MTTNNKNNNNNNNENNNNNKKNNNDDDDDDATATWQTGVNYNPTIRTIYTSQTSAVLTNRL